MKSCNECGAQLVDAAQFCQQCGAKQPEETFNIAKEKCRTCGTELDDEMRFCPKCGLPLWIIQRNNSKLYKDNYVENNVDDILMHCLGSVAYFEEYHGRYLLYVRGWCEKKYYFDKINSLSNNIKSFQKSCNFDDIIACYIADGGLRDVDNGCILTSSNIYIRSDYRSYSITYKIVEYVNFTPFPEIHYDNDKTAPLPWCKNWSIYIAFMDALSRVANVIREG